MTENDPEFPKYILIRSKRKTLGLEIRAGVLYARAPLYMPKGVIEAFIREKRPWIDKTLKKQEMAQIRAEGAELLSREELSALSKQAMRVLSGLSAEYAERIGVRFGRITIRLQKTRWGSCSSKGNLNFNCLLMLTPESVQRYVVVHELCHLLHMNHSPAFWAAVEQVLPDYRKDKKWLRENGPVLMKRAGF